MEEDIDRRKNEAALLIYWACSTDAGIRRAAADRDRISEMLRIPREFIEESVVRTANRYTLLFQVFGYFISKACPRPTCWRATRSELPDKVAGFLFPEGRR